MLKLITIVGARPQIIKAAAMSRAIKNKFAEQKEAFFCHKYCLILLPETEWVELVNAGAAILADANYDRIINGADALLNQNSFIFDNYYGDGQAAEFICETIVKHIPNKI
jgi:UDP-N-acetylglucosamine 2-epimerase